MSVAIGKRKRASSEKHSKASPRTSDEDDHDLQAIFRKAFEERFQPLHIPRTETEDSEAEVSVHEADSDTAWNGLESEDDAPATQVEVFEYRAVQQPEASSRAEARAFMQSRPPSAEHAHKANKPTTEASTEDDKSESLNLKNDLALHRLISESHILSSSSPDSSKHRQKVLDMRLRSLGAKSSFLEQEKMPLSHRRGIAAKSSERDDRRRKEAKENGIILERDSRPRAKSDKRVRGVGGPSIGKFKGGMLTLSKKDVEDIKRPRRNGQNKRGR